MKICLSVLALLVVSACSGELKLKPLDYELNKIYVYEYTGNVLTGGPSSSSLYSGTQLKANVAISHSNARNDLYTLKLDNVTFASLIDEVTEPAKANFARWEAVEQKNQELLELTVQYQINKDTQRLEYIEVYQKDVPWSLNIKKAIIEMLLVDIAGKQLKLVPGYEQSLTQHSRDDIHHAFDVYEPTSKGECETMYQVINALPETVFDLPGSKKLYWKVIKTRNYQNCTTNSRSTRHSYERMNCADHCKQALILGLTKMNNYYSAEKSQCNCNDIEFEPLKQQSTSTYFIECMENPYILSAESNGKVIFDDRGTQFVTYNHQTLKLARVHDGIIDPIDINYVLRVQNLTFSLYSYVGSIAHVSNHEIPVYNLLVPYKSQSTLLDTAIELSARIAEIVLEGDYKNQQKVSSLIQNFVSLLAHLDSEHIMKFYSDYCIVPESKTYTNTLQSIGRQLFLDTVSHVGTQNVSIWLEQVLSWKSNGLSPMEVRQVIETLPFSVHAPTIRLIELLEKKINDYFQEEDWDALSAFVIAYGRLIGKACPNPEVYSDSGKEISIDESKARLNNWWIPEDQKCTVQQTLRYIKALGEKLMTAKSVRGKILIAQALANTGKVVALEELASSIQIRISDDSDQTFFRTSVIYSLHHMITIASKRVRSLILPVFKKKTEFYELRLAAFTVLMSAGPERHEIDSIIVSLRDETNHQFITMVRSILEETANLAGTFHQPLAQAAQEINAILPEVNLDEVRIQASYNEWFSTNKSTGFFVNSQSVVNNASYIPKHSYISFGSREKLLSNPWFSLVFQQKGMESALKNLKLDTAKTRRDPRKVDDLCKDLAFDSEYKEEFLLNLFINVYGETSLFTLDKCTLENAFNQFVKTFSKLTSNGVDKIDFNYVRFLTLSSNHDVIPGAIGLPILATRQNHQIVSFRVTRLDFMTKPKTKLDAGSISFRVVPHIFTSSHLSLSVFNQGVKAQNHFGVDKERKFELYAPFAFVFRWDKNITKYIFRPNFSKLNLYNSNTNFAISSPSCIDCKDEALYKVIPSFPHLYNQSMTFKVKKGLYLNVSLTTEQPLLKESYDGTGNWLLEKYEILNKFNHEMLLTITKIGDKNKKIKKSNAKRGILLFPGLASSKLFTSPSCSRYDQIWYSLFATGFSEECWASLMKLRYDSTTNKVTDNNATIKINFTGTAESVSNIGLKSIVEIKPKSLTIFEDFIEYFNQKGYSNIYGIPMDWRRSVVDLEDRYYERIEYFLNQSFVETNKSSVLVCHSYGCLNLAKFINRTDQSLLKERIHSVFTLGAPWGGSLKAIRALVGGDNFDIFIHLRSIFQPIQKTFTSLVHLMPGPNWVEKRKIEGKPFISLYDKNFYEPRDILKRFGIGDEVMRNRSNVDDFLNYFDKINTTEINCLYSPNFVTLSHIDYVIDSSNIVQEKELTYDDKGDGTVAEFSLSLCHRKNYMISTHTESLHQDMLYDTAIFNLIYQSAEKN